MKRLSIAAVVALAAALAAPAAADPDSGVDAALYRPAFDAFGVYSLDGASGLHEHDFSLDVSLAFAQDPLSLPVPGIGATAEDTETDSVLKRVITTHVTAAFALSKRLSLGLDVGIVRTATDDGYGARGLYRDDAPDPSTGLISLRTLSNIAPGSPTNEGLTGPDDARIGLKYRILTGSFGVAVIGNVFVPFGNEETFLGDANFVFEPKLVIEYAISRSSRIVVNLAARLRERTVLQAYIPATEAPNDARAVFDLGSEALAGMGAVIEVAPQLLIGAEVTHFRPLPESMSWGSCSLVTGAECDTLADDDYFAEGSYGDPALQIMGGARYRMTADTTIGVSGGSSSFMGDGRGDTFRVMAGVTWQPVPEGLSTIGRGDGDGDAIPDQIDICPDEPEDADDYQDDDGCPDLDNDGDGVIDAQDKCSDEPEDRDGYQDDDGCPERDNDGDTVSDVTDRCPNDPEDLDSFEDDDGCPDEDNDGDGIPDAKDKCPNEPESVNGVDDLDGCPDDTASGGPQMDPTRVNLRGAKVDFAGNRSSQLTRASRSVLDDVAKLLTDDYPNVRIRVEVHVSLGTASKNRRAITRTQARDRSLAQDRADQIVRYLVAQGVPADRAQGAGIGSAVPINPRNPTANENERVEFIRTEQ